MNKAWQASTKNFLCLLHKLHRLWVTSLNWALFLSCSLALLLMKMEHTFYQQGFTETCFLYSSLESGVWGKYGLVGEHCTPGLLLPLYQTYFMPSVSLFWWVTSFHFLEQHKNWAASTLSPSHQAHHSLSSLIKSSSIFVSFNFRSLCWG